MKVVCDPRCVVRAEHSIVWFLKNRSDRVLWKCTTLDILSDAGSPAECS